MTCHFNLYYFFTFSTINNILHGKTLSDTITYLQKYTEQLK